MVTRTEAKEKLLEFLDQKAFDPILEETPREYSGSDREDLEDVQRATQSQKDRFHTYESAQKIKEMYRDDLHSSKARDINRKLDRLQLPTLPLLQDEFFELCEELGV